MMDSSLEMERSCDVSILLKSKKEHYEKEMEKLISYIGQEFRAADPLSLIGKRFRDKEEEFSDLRRKNQELLLKTKELNDDLQRLRGSSDSIHWGDLHVPMERTVRLESLIASKEGTTAETSQLRAMLDGLDAELEDVRAEETDIKHEYDQLIECVISYLTRDKVAQRLTTEIEAKMPRENSGEVEMVTVPRKRYEQLIEVYSINIAEISVNELRHSLKNAPQEAEQHALKYVEEANRTYQQKYADLAKGEEVDVKDLHQLFRALARKVGFEREWERYHQENTNSAVAFKGKIDSIFTFDPLAQKDGEQQPSTLNTLQFRQLLTKLNRLVDQLPFEPVEKNEWQRLSTKIKEDRLVSMESVAKRYQEIVSKETTSLVSKVAILLQSTFEKSLEQFSKVVRSKLRLKEVSWGKSMESLNAEGLRQAVEERLTAGEDVWRALHDVIQQRASEIYKKVEKNLIFCSGAKLFQASANRK